MSDVHCKVCGEPYDEYGLHHGDMLAWETDAFLKGLGCPCCQGIPKRHEDGILHRRLRMELEQMNAAIDLNAPALMPDVEAPKGKWEEPDPMVIGTCHLCGKDIEVPQNEIYYDGRGKKKYSQYFNPQKYGENIYCDSCFHKLETCDFCGKKFEPDDTRYSQDLYEVICNDCDENGEITCCEECGQEVHSSDCKRGLNGSFYCECCFDSKYSKCEKCETLCEQEDLNEDNLCSNCAAKDS